jgi:hypothetical protein
VKRKGECEEEESNNTKRTYNVKRKRATIQRGKTM